jgi:flagellar biosynthesis/type III secretory pathway M-ring protein FliF/YscJ
MRLVELECQNCGAALKIEEGADIVHCPYCDAKYKMDDEVQHVKYDDMENSGYEFEKGRIKAQKEHLENNNIMDKSKTFMMFIPFIIISIIVMVAFVGIRSANRKGFEKASNSITSVNTEEANKENEEQKKKELESKARVFNMGYSNGRQATVHIERMLNSIITNNRTNKERIITVKFKDIETQESEQILEIEKQLEEFGYYDVLFDYDEDGFINVMTIK